MERRELINIVQELPKCDVCISQSQSVKLGTHLTGFGQIHIQPDWELRIDSVTNTKALHADLRMFDPITSGQQDSDVMNDAVEIHELQVS